jgi:hypothetical protein
MTTNTQRKFCPRCSIKHLGQARAITYLSQARVLLKETQLGYPEHVWYALGHMAEASDEIVEWLPDEASLIRQERLKLEDTLRTGGKYEVPFADLMHAVARGGMLEEAIDELLAEEHVCES